MDRATITQHIKQAAYQLGFDRCRVVPVGPAPHADFFDAWIGAGHAGDMGYLARYRERRRDPSLLALPPTESSADGGGTAEQVHPDTYASFRSMIVLAVDYHQFDLPEEILNDPSRGIIARYAWGDDYHELIRPLLYELDSSVRQLSGRKTQGKGLVDTGPVLERDWAHLAGIGFTGKNCCTIHPQQGSWLFLATLLIPEQLDYDPLVKLGPEPSPEAVLAGLSPAQDYGQWMLPLVAHDPEAHDIAHDIEGVENERATRLGTCGRCTRCMDDCPTDAFVGPFHLNPHRCIAYWTIETQAAIPRQLRAHFGNRIFGCDICQEVCPWNRQQDKQETEKRKPRLAGLAAQEGRVAPPLLEGFDAATPYWLDDAAFSAQFRRSPIKRAKRRGMARNVCVALGNWGDPAVLPALEAAVRDGSSVVRSHAAWAVGQILRRTHHPPSYELLAQSLAQETNETVRQEIALALATHTGAADVEDIDLDHSDQMSD